MSNEKENKNESPESSQPEQAKEESSVQEIVPEKKKKCKKVFARNPMPSDTPQRQAYKALIARQKNYVREKQTNTQGIRLDKLSFGTLRRYQYYFKLDR